MTTAPTPEPARHSTADGLDFCQRCDVPPRVRRCGITQKWTTECPNCGSGSNWNVNQTASGLAWNKMQRKARADK